MSGSLIEEGLFFGPTGNPFQYSDTTDSATAFAVGQVGKVCAYSNPGGANGVSGNSPVVVQAVKRYATDSGAPIVGQPAFWQDTDNYVVTTNYAVAVGSTTAPLVAGVFAGTALSAASIGFIQVAGVAPARIADSTSATANSAGFNLSWSTGTFFAPTATLTTTVTLGTFQPVGTIVATTTATTTSGSGGVYVEAALNVVHLNW